MPSLQQGHYIIPALGQHRWSVLLKTALAAAPGPAAEPSTVNMACHAIFNEALGFALPSPAKSPVSILIWSSSLFSQPLRLRSLRTEATGRTAGLPVRHHQEAVADRVWLSCSSKSLLCAQIVLACCLALLYCTHSK